MRRLFRTTLALGLLTALAWPAASFAQGAAGTTDTAGETDTGETENQQKNWTVAGGIETRVGQGTFVGLENDTNTPGEKKPNSSAYDRANIIYSFTPSYTWNEFTFGADLSLVQWLTAGAGIYGFTSSGGANEPSDIFFQDIGLSASWKGYTFDSIGLTLAPSLDVGLPTHKISRLNTKLFDVGASLALTRNFFDRLTLQGSVSGAKYFYRYKTAAVQLDRVGQQNVLFRSGGPEELGNGLVALDGYNLSAVFSVGGAANIKIWKQLSGSVSYGFVNYYYYQGPDGDQYTAENAQPEGPNLSQAVSTSVQLSYGVTDWLSVDGGIGTFMSPKTSDNKSLRFPFWNTQGAAANRSWLSLGVRGSY